MNKQLWICRNGNELKENLFKPVNNDGNLKIKGGGGLWTSTFIDENKGSDWVQWCLENDFCLPENEWHGYLLELKDNLALYTIDTLTDMHELFDEYGYNPYPQVKELSMEGIDFLKLSKDFDGLHLTEHGQMVTRHGFSFFRSDFFDEKLKEEWKNKTLRNFYGWDCESTFHFRWNFKKVEPIVLKLEREENEVY